MKRDYDIGTSGHANFFIGKEIEKTPAYGKKTLFVVGLQDPEKVERYYYNQSCEHIFFGANHSFNGGNIETWEAMIRHFLKKEIWCTLDIPISVVEEALEMCLTEHRTFIPQIRVAVPYATTWGYNAMLKIDDRGFKDTNPGVWCHNLHDLLPREKFTCWDEYRLDSIIE
jgi:hypothetical protein